jgi:hypothetical protein
MLSRKGRVYDRAFGQNRIGVDGGAVALPILTQLDRDLETDICVVGAGISGLTTGI